MSTLPEESKSLSAFLISLLTYEEHKGSTCEVEVLTLIKERYFSSFKKFKDLLPLKYKNKLILNLQEEMNEDDNLSAIKANKSVEIIKDNSANDSPIYEEIIQAKKKPRKHFPGNISPVKNKTQNNNVNVISDSYSDAFLPSYGNFYTQNSIHQKPIGSNNPPQNQLNLNNLGLLASQSCLTGGRNSHSNSTNNLINNIQVEEDESPLPSAPSAPSQPSQAPPQPPSQAPSLNTMLTKLPKYLNEFLVLQKNSNVSIEKNSDDTINIPFKSLNFEMKYLTLDLLNLHFVSRGNDLPYHTFFNSLSENQLRMFDILCYIWEKEYLNSETNSVKELTNNSVIY